MRAERCSDSDCDTSMEDEYCSDSDCCTDNTMPDHCVIKSKEIGKAAASKKKALASNKRAESHTNRKGKFEYCYHSDCGTDQTLDVEVNCCDSDDDECLYAKGKMKKASPMKQMKNIKQFSKRKVDMGEACMKKHQFSSRAVVEECDSDDDGSSVEGWAGSSDSDLDVEGSDQDLSF